MREINFKITTNKYVSLDCKRYIQEWSWFEAVVKITRKCDHAGVSIYLEAFRFCISFNLYDVRHWDYDKDKWKVYKDKKK